MYSIIDFFLLLFKRRNTLLFVKKKKEDKNIIIRCLGLRNRDRKAVREENLNQDHIKKVQIQFVHIELLEKMSCPFHILNLCKMISGETLYPSKKVPMNDLLGLLINYLRPVQIVTLKGHGFKT